METLQLACSSSVEHQKVEFEHAPVHVSVVSFAVVSTISITDGEAACSMLHVVAPDERAVVKYNV